MPEIIDVRPVDRVQITTLMDNYTDILLPSTDVVKRHPLADELGQPVEQPVAGHGFSLLVDVYQDGERHTALLDAGFPIAGVEHNWRVLGVDLARVEAVLLSHGHADHFAALELFLAFRNRSVPLVIHPEAFLKRALIFPDGTQANVEQLPASEVLADLGADLVLTTKPHQLVPGLFSTGEVARSTPFEGRLPIAYVDVDNEWLPDDFHDDQALFLLLRNRGLVVMTGCAHAGIINTVRQAQALTGEKRVHAIVGGFHLTGAPAAKIEATIEALIELAPDIIVPTHCTGFEAKCRMARRMPGPWVLNSVGTRILLSSA